MCTCDGVHYPTVRYPYRLLVDSSVGIVSVKNNIIVQSGLDPILGSNPDCSR